jgi:hypothetical protein
MQTINLYKYIREDGGTTISPVKPDCEYTEMYRLVADEGKILVNGDILTYCTDVENPEGWSEVVDIYIPEDDEDITGDELLQMIEEVL